MAKAVPYEKDYEGILGLTTTISTNEEQEFYIYPNPANHFIQLSIGEQGKLRIIDITGKVMHSESFMKSSRINTDIFPNGIYNIQLQTAEHVYNKLLIIQ